MTVRCTFEHETDVNRNGNILEIRNTISSAMVRVSILSKDGKVVENESVVDGEELIKAIQNAMNWRKL